MNRIKQLREEKNITQLQLAEKLNKTQQTISLYENGINEPDLDSYIVLSKIFGYSIEYIAGKSDIRNPEIQSPTENKLDLDGLDTEDFIQLQNLIHYIHHLKEKNQ